MQHLADERNGAKGSWHMRRRFMFIVAGFCMWTVAYVLLKDKDTEAAKTAIEMAFWTLLGITGSYVFGASWDDLNKMKFAPGKKQVKAPEPDAEKAD